MRTKTFMVHWVIVWIDLLSGVVLTFSSITRAHYYCAWDLRYLFKGEEFWQIWRDGRIQFHLIYVLHIFVSYFIEYFSPWFKWFIHFALVHVVQGFTKEVKYRKIKLVNEFELERQFYLAYVRQRKYKRIDRYVGRDIAKWERFLFDKFREFEKYSIRRLFL